MNYTTRALVDQIRQQINEDNGVRVSNNQILSALNRGNDDAFDIMARLYPDPLVEYFETTPDTNGYIDIPETVFEDRIMLVEYYVNGAAQGRVEIRETDDLHDVGNQDWLVGGHPSVYTIVGRRILVAPTKSAYKYTFRVWYAREIEQLKLDQGRIQIIDRVNNYIVVDSLNNTDSDGVTTNGLLAIDPSSAYGKYFNICDATTGELKTTMQVETINGNQLVLKTVPTRSTVLNKAVVGAIPDTVNEDDVISQVDGIGVVFFKKPVTNYIIQFAVNEIQRSLGAANLSYEVSTLRDLRKTVEGTWKRRPASRFKKSYARVWRNRRFRATW